MRLLVSFSKWAWLPFWFNINQVFPCTQHILEREENWISWKNEGCPSFIKERCVAILLNLCALSRVNFSMFMWTKCLLISMAVQLIASWRITESAQVKQFTSQVTIRCETNNTVFDKLQCYFSRCKFKLSQF